jgi:hypothetical protein
MMKISTEAGIGFYSEEGKKIRKSTAYLMWDHDWTVGFCLLPVILSVLMGAAVCFVATNNLFVAV